MQVHLCTHVWGGRRQSRGVILKNATTSVNIGALPGLELTSEVGVAEQCAPKIGVFMSPQLWNYKHILSDPALFYVGSRD